MNRRDLIGWQPRAQCRCASSAQSAAASSLTRGPRLEERYLSGPVSGTRRESPQERCEYRSGAPIHRTSSLVAGRWRLSRVPITTSQEKGVRPALRSTLLVGGLGTRGSRQPRPGQRWRPRTRKSLRARRPNKARGQRRCAPLMVT